MERVFISYKRLDKDKVFPLKEKIEAAIGEPCWIDLDGIESDAQFSNVIINAITSADIFLFMYSQKHALITDFEKDWTAREILFAQEKDKRIVFVNLDKTPLTDWFKFMFGTKQHVNATSSEEFDRLLKDMKKWLPEKKHTDNSTTLFQAQGNRNSQLHVFIIFRNGYGSSKIINNACDNMLRKLDIIHSDVDIMMNILEYNQTAQWMYPKPTRIEDFKWHYIAPSIGTNLAKALTMLNDRLKDLEQTSKKVRLFRKSIILLISNGESTNDSLNTLLHLQENPFFVHADKYAINVEFEPNLEHLAAFTGKKRKVFDLQQCNEKELTDLLERLMHIGLYAGSSCELEDDDWGHMDDISI